MRHQTSTTEPTTPLLTRRGFVGGAAAAAVGLLAACGSDDDGPASASTTPTAPATTVAPSATLSVSNSYGTYEIPRFPQRVVALENRRDIETAVVLKLPVIAVGSFGAETVDGSAVAPFVPFTAAGVEVFDNSEVNFEHLLTLAPDLLLAREIFVEDDPSRLSAIAPFLPIGAEGSWRDDLLQVASWLDRVALLNAELDQYDAELAAVRARHATALASEPVAIVEYYPADRTFYAGGLTDFQLQANTLGELGGSLIPLQADRSYFDEPVSFENVGELASASAILLVLGVGESDAALRGEALWQALPAVAAGRVVVTDTRTNQGSVYAATECLRLLDLLYTAIDGAS